MSILEFQNLSYTYDTVVPVLNNQSYAFEKGKIYAIAGLPGSGKTTLLYLLAGLTDPAAGAVLFDGKDLRNMDRSHYRSHTIGTLFKEFDLLPQLSAVENVELSVDLAELNEKDKHQYAADMLNKVGFNPSALKLCVSKLSEGDRQRASIARILSYHPDVLLVDEPSDTLDSGTQQQMMEIFTSLAHEEGTCVILATHSSEAAKIADAVFELSPAAPAINQPEPKTETTSTATE